MNYTTIVGYIAAFCTTVAFLPQAIKVYRTKQTKDLSMPMYTIFVVGVGSWFCYGILTKSPPIIIANAVTFLLGAYILLMKVKYG